MITKASSLNIIPSAESNKGSDIVSEKNLNPAQLERNEKIKKQFKEVAGLYEKQFMREMVKSMRSTVSESGLIKTNQAEKIFREQLDQEYVEKWGDRGGMGLSDLIYNQLVERYGERMGLKDSVAKPVGPLQLLEKDSMRIQAQTVAKKSSETNLNSIDPNSLPDKSENELQFQFSNIKKNEKGMTQVKQPWSGYLTKKLQLAPDEYFLEMNHDNGMKSQFKFKGSLANINLNEFQEEGKNLGYLNPDNSQLLWNLKIK